MTTQPPAVSERDELMQIVSDTVPDGTPEKVADAILRRGYRKTPAAPSHETATYGRCDCGVYVGDTDRWARHRQKVGAAPAASEQSDEATYLGRPVSTVPGWVRSLYLGDQPWGHWCCQAGAMADPDPCPFHRPAASENVTLRAHEALRADVIWDNQYGWSHPTPADREKIIGALADAGLLAARRAEPGSELEQRMVDDLVSFWHTRDHGKLLDEAARDLIRSHTLLAGCESDGEERR